MSAIYLGCPYSHSDWKQRELRFHLVSRAAGRLMLQGHVVYSPISHSHPVCCVTPGLRPKGWEDFWREQDFWFLARAERLTILALPGWERSVGLQAEIAYAEARGIEIEQELPTDDDLCYGEQVLRKLDSWERLAWKGGRKPEERTIVYLPSEAAAS